MSLFKDSGEDSSTSSTREQAYYHVLSHTFRSFNHRNIEALKRGGWTNSRKHQ